jgi:hypothetical protein
LLLFGTIVLAIVSHDAVYVGVDSKVISVGTGTTNANPQLKIHHTRDVVFAHAGIFKDAHGKYDVVATASAAIQEGSDLEDIARRFITSIEPQLLAVLPEIRAQNPSYFREKLKRPLEMLFASARGGKPRMIAAYFEVLDPSAADLGLRATLLRCPGDCPSGITEMALGEHDAADQYLDSHPEILRTRGPIVAVQKAIAAQASATPDFVSLPATVFTIDILGIHKYQ